MKNQLFRRLRVFGVAALAALACTGAFAQKASADTTTWKRIWVNCQNTYQEFPVITVPTSSTKPYFLRQTYSSALFGSGVAPGSFSGALLYATDPSGQIYGYVPLMTGSQTQLNVPFSPGEDLRIVCYNALGHWLLVFSY